MSEYGYYGYVRKDGKVGSRNHVAIIPSVVCANEVVEAIVANTVMTQGIIHHQGCCQTPPDLERITDCLIKIGENPNVGASLIVSLGCEGVDTDRLEEALRATGKPLARINIQELGGTSASIQAGIDAAQKLVLQISGLQRERADMSSFVMGIKCGASDTTSGIASNPVIGYMADKVVDMGGTVIFGETTEFIGAEHILQRRARTPEIAAEIGTHRHGDGKPGQGDRGWTCARASPRRATSPEGLALLRRSPSVPSLNRVLNPLMV